MPPLVAASTTSALSVCGADIAGAAPSPFTSTGGCASSLGRRDEQVAPTRTFHGEWRLAAARSRTGAYLPIAGITRLATSSMPMWRGVRCDRSWRRPTSCGSGVRMSPTPRLISGETPKFLRDVVSRFGRPTEPIEIRAPTVRITAPVHDAEPATASENERETS